MYNRDELTIASGISQCYVTSRFTSRFTIFNLPAPNDLVLTRIFSSILNNFLKNGFVDPVQSMANNIVSASVAFYRKVKSELLPTPSRSHYTFNLRDVSRVFKAF